MPRKGEFGSVLYRHLDDDKIRKMYLDDKMSVPKIAELVECKNKQTIRNILIRQGVKLRSSSEAALLSGQTRKDRVSYQGINSSYWYNIRAGAVSRDIDFCITIEEAWNLFVEQNGKCALSGVHIVLAERFKKTEQTASLDRIDSNKGYLLSNCQWVHKVVQNMKWDLPEDRMIQLCNLVMANNHEYFI